MNNPNPFVPKGSLLEQQSYRRSRLKFWVGGVAGVSCLALVVMLIQGCHRENPDTQTAMDTNNTTPGLDLTNNLPPAETNSFATPFTAPMAPSNSVATAPMPPSVAVTPPVAPPVEPPTAGTDYVVKSGDTLGKIAKANGVSLKALLAANPGIDPKKLKPGKKITIPAGGSSAGAATASAPGAAPMADATTGGQSYVVKSGDTLTKIAKHFSVSVKALRSANPKIAATDHIHVGDKLNIPVKGGAAAAATADAGTSAPVPPPVSTPAPAPTTPPAPGH